MRRSGTVPVDPGAPARRPPLPDPVQHRKRTARQVRHDSRALLRSAALDDEILDDADLICPRAAHDLGRRSGPKPSGAGKPGRRRGFKVWKTPFWKRRRAMWAQRNTRTRRVALGD
jgi:hypothetical protein